jgi:hypothetical protein
MDIMYTAQEPLVAALSGSQVLLAGGLAGMPASRSPHACIFDVATSIANETTPPPLPLGKQSFYYIAGGDVIVSDVGPTRLLDPHLECESTLSVSRLSWTSPSCAERDSIPEVRFHDRFGAPSSFGLIEAELVHLDGKTWRVLPRTPNAPIPIDDPVALDEYTLLGIHSLTSNVIMCIAAS